VGGSYKTPVKLYLLPANTRKGFHVLITFHRKVFGIQRLDEAEKRMSIDRRRMIKVELWIKLYANVDSQVCINQYPVLI
jgi:hypothetical protein